MAIISVYWLIYIAYFVLPYKQLRKSQIIVEKWEIWSSLNYIEVVTLEMYFQKYEKTMFFFLFVLQNNRIIRFVWNKFIWVVSCDCFSNCKYWFNLTHKWLVRLFFFHSFPTTYAPQLLSIIVGWSALCHIPIFWVCIRLS